MVRHAGDVPIEVPPGHPPYGADGPPARLRACYLRRNDPDREPEDLGPRLRIATDLTRWEKAVALVPVAAIALVFIFLLPALGVPSGLAYWVGWTLSHGPLYWAADTYAAGHEPWRGPRWLRRKPLDPTA